MRVSSSGVVTSWGAMTRLTVKPRREIGRGENGRQICRAMTWKVPENLSKVRPGKAVQRAAADWEEARAAYEKTYTTRSALRTRRLTAQKQTSSASCWGVYRPKMGTPKTAACVLVISIM